MFIVSYNCEANDSIFLRNWKIDATTHYGFILPLYQAIGYTIQDQIPAFEIKIYKQSYGQIFWDQLYRYPKSGIGYSYWDLKNPEVFGKAHALYGFMNVPFSVKERKMMFDYQICFGLVYLTRWFDIYDNYLNRAIGSRFNMYIRLSFDTRFKINNRIEGVVEAGLTHFSNGKLKTPNYGLNLLTGSLGFAYALQPPKKKIFKKIPPLEKRYFHSIYYSAGVKVYDNLYGSKYFISSVCYDAERALNHKRRFGLGADFFYDASIKEGLEDKGKLDSEFKDYIRFGLHILQTVRYNKLYVSIYIGHYLYSKYTDLSLVYSRLAVRYALSKNILVGLALKSHMAKADFIEWGLGVEL